MGSKVKGDNRQAPTEKGKTGPTESIITDKRRATLCHEDAVASSPDDLAVMGEEDAGCGIEFLIRECEERARLEQERNTKEHP